jgi:hypothetical protein
MNYIFNKNKKKGYNFANNANSSMNVSQKIKLKRSRTMEIKDEITSNLKKFHDDFYKVESKPINWERIKNMFVVIAIFLLEIIIQGNSFFKSLFGIEKYTKKIEFRCSVIYWLIFLIPFFIFIKISHMVYSQFDAEYKYEDILQIKTNKQKLIENYKIIFIFGIYSGMVSGLLGVGGGLIMINIMINLGYDLVIAQSTSNLLIIYTCTINFIFYFFEVENTLINIGRNDL